MILYDSGTDSISTETDLVSTQTTLGVFVVVFSLTPLTTDDILQFRVYEKARDAAESQELLDYVRWDGDQGPRLWHSIPYPLGIGWKVSLQCDATLDFDWHIWQLDG